MKCRCASKSPKAGGIPCPGHGLSVGGEGYFTAVRVQADGPAHSQRQENARRLEHISILLLMTNRLFQVVFLFETESLICSYCRLL
jgi:hypothetical protein